MPRKGNVPKREVLPDPVYGSVVVSKLIHIIILSVYFIANKGGKATAKGKALLGTLCRAAANLQHFCIGNIPQMPILCIFLTLFPHTTAEIHNKRRYFAFLLLT